MIEIDINKIDESGKKRRFIFDEIKRFIDSGVILGCDTDGCKFGKILVLKGLANTGKTTLLRQVICEYREAFECAFLELEADDDMDAVYLKLMELEENGVKIVCIANITLVEDFIENSGILADRFARDGMKIIISGDENLSILFAARKSLLYRTIWLSTTHISYAEHTWLLGGDFDEYISHGGLLGDSDKAEYIKSAVARNIAISTRRDYDEWLPCYTEPCELESIVAKLLAVFSGEKLRVRRSNYCVSRAFDFYEVVDGGLFLRNEKRIENLNDIAWNLRPYLNIKIPRDLILELEKCLEHIGILSTLTSVNIAFNESCGLKRLKKKEEYCVLCPAIKYHCLKQSLKSEQIRKSMIEQILLFDTKEALKYEKSILFEREPKYSVFKVNFSNPEGALTYDLLIKNNDLNGYYAFKIAHLSSDEKAELRDEKVEKIASEYFGKKLGSAILYSTKDFKGSDEEMSFSIWDFLLAIYKHKDIELALSELGLADRFKI